MKAVLLVVSTAITTFASSFCIAQDHLEDNMEVGDTLVLAANTDVVLAYKSGQRNMVTYNYANDAVIMHNGTKYKILNIVPVTVKALTSDGQYAITVTAREIGGEQYFTAEIPAALRHKNRRKAWLPPCMTTSACSGSVYVSCTVMRGNGCKRSCDSIDTRKCTYSDSKDKTSLAYAIEQYFVNSSNSK